MCVCSKFYSYVSYQVRLVFSIICLLCRITVEVHMVVIIQHIASILNPRSGIASMIPGMLHIYKIFHSGAEI